MTVWYFDNEDCSGIFSSKEKALESFWAGAKRCGWRNVEIIDNGEWVRIIYFWDDNNDAPHFGECYISAYTLDEDHFG